MTIPFKPRVAKTICRIDRKTQAVTAGVNFEDIDLRINGEGSEVYDYEYMFVLHSVGVVYLKVDSLASYTRDTMRGVGSSANALSTSSSSVFNQAVCDDSTYPSFKKTNISGKVGNKRHSCTFGSEYDNSNTLIIKESRYTNDTSTELTSMQLYSPSTATITYTLVITAVPKIQYNPHAILLKDLTLSSQTADIIFGGVNDTEGVDDLDGNVYDYYVVSSGLSEFILIYKNEITSSANTYQRLANQNGSIASVNTTVSFDAGLIGSTISFINSEVGRKLISADSRSQESSEQQQEAYATNPDTSTKMTSLLLRPSASVSGNVQLYAVPKGYNADLTPWDFRQVYSVSNASFAGGNTFEIPSWAMFARIQVVGESASGSNINIDFDTTTSVDKQYLKSSTSSTTASFATNRTIGKIQKVSNIDCIVALKSGANRPMLSKSNYNENTIDINGLWALDSSSNYTGLILNADNTNAMNAEIVVSYI